MSKGYVTTRNFVAVAAHQRSGAGKHGGSAKQQHKRSRKVAKQELRGQRTD